MYEMDTTVTLIRHLRRTVSSGGANAGSNKLG